MEPAAWILLGLLGTWAALDGTSAGQFMVSRPLVTGTTTGAVLGDPLVGFQLGLVLELAHLGLVPVGAARIPEPGPAAIGATTLALGAGGGAGLATGLALGMVLSALGGTSIVLHRRLNGRLVQGLDEGRLSPAALDARLAVAIASDAARGLVLTLGGLAAAGALAPLANAWWPLADRASWMAVLLLLAFPAGIMARAMGGAAHRTALLAAAAAVGAALGAWLTP